MDDFSLQALEFSKILQYTASFCRSEAGKNAVLALRPFSSLSKIEHFQQLFDEYQLWKTKGEFSLHDFPDVSPILEKSTGQRFSPDAEDFWAMREVLKLAKSAYVSVHHFEGELPLFAGEYDFPFPEKSYSALMRCIADDASFKDESSPALLLVRNELRSLHQSCLRKVKDFSEQYNIAHYLQDDFMTIVGDRYVLPLKANFKGRLQGIIHDYSRTGETLYFEPMFLVELNNRLQDLKQEEREEINKIILLLADLFLQEEEGLKKAWDFLVMLDVNEAKCGLASAYIAKHRKGQGLEGYPVSFGHTLSLLHAYHPLLLLENNRQKSSVSVQAIDLVFRSQDRVLVISGGNSGGKTVALKTLGLIGLMSLTALPVPVAKGSSILFWQRIHAFIGDEQSLDDHVSTFTGQIRHLASIWDELDSSHLLLLDEFGAGTDPSQGAALAQAVLDGILEKRCYAVSATHFPALKTYALTNTGVRAASVLFDEQNKKPLYKLAYDQVGASKALDVAREHGLSEEILARASHYLLVDTKEQDGVIAKLNAVAVEREKELEHLQRELQKTKQKREQLQEKYERDVEALQKEFREKSQELMRAWKAEKISAKEAMKKLGQIRTELGKNETEKAEAAPVEENALKIGIEVLHRPWNKKALVQEIDSKAKKVKINLGGVAMWASFNDIEITGSSAKPSIKASVTQNISQNKSGFALDLRGKRADLAIADLHQFLDNALLAGYDTVEIIHGRGTGALRKAVHEVLKGYSHIASFALATEENGGDGMTVVTFR